MNTKERRTVDCIAATGETHVGAVEIVHLSQTERLRRAAKITALTWLGALIALPLPIIHFIAVPLLVVAGPLAGAWLYRQKSSVFGSEVSCPVCGRQELIKNRPDRWPILEVCSECKTSLRIELQDPAAA